MAVVMLISKGFTSFAGHRGRPTVPNKMVQNGLCIFFSLLCLSRRTEAAAILGFAIPGGASHYASVAGIGLDLMHRGHKFTVLVSSEDTVAQRRMAKDPFRAVKVLKFKGPANIGNDIWRINIPRDPSQVGSEQVDPPSRFLFIFSQICNPFQ